jgi:phosphoribosyl 1,2-cyclic phosphate phosphodiesterase
MRLEFLGTGGATTTPRPTCHCPICDEARAKGLPYARTGPSLFVHGPDLLLDTPEESKFQINRAGIDHIGGCFYSHWHPDHTLGRRVFESLFMGKFRHRWQTQPVAPVPIYLAPQVGRDFGRFMALADHFAYMSERGWTTMHPLAEDETVRLGGVSVRAVQLADPSVYAFLLEENGRRVLIAMDELVGWQPPDWLRGVDVAVLPMGIVEFDPFGDQRWIPAGHPILQVEATFQQTLEMARALAPKQLYFAHIEEADGLGYDDLLRLQERLRGDGLSAMFAFDGLQVDVV